MHLEEVESKCLTEMKDNNYLTIWLDNTLASRSYLVTMAVSNSANSWIASLVDFGAGFISGSVSIFVGQPFDTIKVRLQTNSSFGGPLECLRHTLRTEGPRALFKGVTSPVASQSAVNATIFGVYGSTLRALGHGGDGNNGAGAPPARAPLSAVFVAGSAAGLVQTVFVSPADLIKCKLQVQTASKAEATYKGPIDVIKQVVKQNGPRGMMRGWVATFWRETPSFGLYFVIYEAVLRQLTDPNSAEGPSWVTSAIAGAVTGSLTWASIYPFDVVKSRIQTMPDSTPAADRRILKVFADLHRQHGTQAFYRGLGTTMLRAMPVNGVLFPVYEIVVQTANSMLAESKEQ